MISSNQNADLAVQNTWNKSNEEVRKSLDVLDKVLSEFDDIEGLSDFDDEDRRSPRVATDEGSQSSKQSESPPPPINRALKPKMQPPKLPLKQGRISPVKKIEVSDSKSSWSEASSHEYQEINNVLLETKKQTTTRSRSLEPEKPVIVAPEPKKPEPIQEDRRKGPITQLRKSQSGDIPVEDQPRGRRFERRPQPKRSSSSNRLLDDKRPVFHSMPHQRQENKMPSNMIHTLPHDFAEPSLDNRFMDPRMGYDGMPPPFMMNANFFGDPRTNMPDNRYLYNEMPPFAHILHEAPLHSLPVRGIDFLPQPLPLDYPPDLPPYEYPMMGPPFLPPEFMDGGMHGPYPPPMDYMGPQMHPLDMAPHLFDHPMNMGMGYPANYPMDGVPPDMMDLQARADFQRQWMSQGPYDPRINNGWPYAEPQDPRARVEDIMRHQEFARGNRKYQPEFDRRDQLQNQNRSSRRAVSTGPSEMTRKSMEGRVPPRSYSFGSEPQESVFRVGEAVREHSKERQTMSKETVSLPQFTSCGKDSGFDEGLALEESPNSNGRKSPHPNGGGFIVSGVFNDSSKMYIPAPPSPTPDYDEEAMDSDGAESDIMHKSLYEVPEKSSPRTTSHNAPHSGSNRSSVSEDSLQECTSRKGSQTQTLQAMIHEFHQGLPLPKEDGCYSDDSLEESSATQSRPSTIGRHSKTQMSMESLISMDGSTTSFDYLSASNSRNTSPKKTRTTKANFKQSKHISSSKNQINNGKFDTIRHMIKRGLIEGLDEQPPAFKPPPLTMSNLSILETDRPDSGINSGASTSRTNGSGGSDSFSDKSTGAPIVKSLSLSYSTGPIHNGKTSRPLSTFSLNDSAPPILSPSMHYNPQCVGPTTPPAPQNNSWLHKKKRQAPLPGNANSSSHHSQKNDKITHVDYIQSEKDELLSSSPSSPMSVTDSPSFGTIEKHEWISSEPQMQPDVLPNKKESSTKKSERLSALGNEARGSRLSLNGFKPNKKPTKESISAPTEFRKLDTDIRGVPRTSSAKTAPSPPSGSFTTDRFESIEDLTGGARNRTSTNPKDSSTHPLTSAEDEVREFRKTASLIVGKKKKDDESRFKFKFFNGFWRKNKYSFDKA